MPFDSVARPDPCFLNRMFVRAKPSLLCPTFVNDYVERFWTPSTLILPFVWKFCSDVNAQICLMLINDQNVEKLVEKT